MGYWVLGEFSLVGAGLADKSVFAGEELTAKPARTSENSPSTQYPIPNP